MSHTISFDVLKHELAHIAGSKIAGAKACKLWHDGESWLVSNAWPSRPTDEQKALCFAAGAILAPAQASADDVAVLAMMPTNVRDPIVATIERKVRPIWLEMLADEANLLAMKATCEAEGGLVVEWETLH